METASKDIMAKIIHNKFEFELFCKKTRDIHSIIVFFDARIDSNWMFDCESGKLFIGFPLGCSSGGKYNIYKDGREAIYWPIFINHSVNNSRRGVYINDRGELCIYPFDENDELLMANETTINVDLSDVNIDYDYMLKHFYVPEQQLRISCYDNEGHVIPYSEDSYYGCVSSYEYGEMCPLLKNFIVFDKG